MDRQDIERGFSERNEQIEVVQMPVADLEPDGHGVLGYVIIIFVCFIDICLFPLTMWFAISVLSTYQRGIVLRLGKLTRSTRDPVRKSGVVFKIPFIDSLYKVDTRMKTVNIPPQEILTSDSVTAKIDAVVYMYVVDASLALLRVENWQESAELMAVSLVRKILGKCSLSELLTCRQDIDRELKTELDLATDPWGIKVDRVEITDIVLPSDMQRAMAAEAQATRAAKAKILSAQGELDSAKTLKEAAMEISKTPAALQLRLLQTLSNIAAEQNSTIVFPLPIELLSLVSGKT